jgi:uncharacterized protein (DUF305 family)
MPDDALSDAALLDRSGGPGLPDEPGTDDPALDEDDPDGHRRWFQPPTLLQAVGMVVVLLFLGAAAGWVVGERGAQPAPNDADIGFLQDMTTHHEQAVEMAYMAIDQAEDPAVRHYGQEILFFQARELGLMAQLLDRYGIDTSERPDDAMAWMGMSVPAAAMPGMASEEQLEQLRAAEGAEFDQLFVELMTNHHLGGIHMADAAIERVAEDDVRDLAENFLQVQQREVAEFRRLQEDLGFPVTG